MPFNQRADHAGGKDHIDEVGLFPTTLNRVDIVGADEHKITLGQILDTIANHVTGLTMLEPEKLEEIMRMGCFGAALG